LLWPPGSRRRLPELVVRALIWPATNWISQAPACCGLIWLLVAGGAPWGELDLVNSQTLTLCVSVQVREKKERK
jgi:hypothetical protein